MNRSGHVRSFVSYQCCRTSTFFLLLPYWYLNYKSVRRARIRFFFLVPCCRTSTFYYLFVYSLRIRMQHFGQCGSGSSSGSEISADEKNVFFGSKIAIYLSLGLNEERPIYSPRKRTSSLSKHENFFNIFGSFLPSLIRIQLSKIINADPDHSTALICTDPDRFLIVVCACARGGIHDHISGGFARYSTDGQWHVPHFEKMLYDQVNFILSPITASRQSVCCCRLCCCVAESGSPWRTTCCEKKIQIFQYYTTSYD
jgi:hypothetical protein